MTGMSPGPVFMKFHAAKFNSTEHTRNMGVVKKNTVFLQLAHIRIPYYIFLHHLADNVLLAVLVRREYE